MAASMPLSRFGLSVAQFSILGIWLIDARFRQKINLFFRNQAALILVSFYLLHVIGMLYTTDYSYGWKDLRVKLPLLFLPVVFVTMPKLNRERIRLLLFVYIFSVLLASLVSLWMYLFEEVRNFRELSPFISHIRLSLNACLALFFTAHFAFVVYKNKRWITLGLSALVGWFFLFLIMIESITGIAIVIILVYGLMGYGLFRMTSLRKKVGSLLVLITIPVTLGLFLSKTVSEFIHPHKNDLKNLEQFTEKGNPYVHDTLNQPVENGSYIWIYVCPEELESAWHQVSRFSFDSLDESGQEIRYTLIRYLNSKDLRKDYSGVMALSENDIRNIEKGIANVNYTHFFSFKSRIYKLLWEIQVSRLDGNPSGHSLTQRFEFWKVSMAIVWDHFLFGVGTGDIKTAYADMYETLDSPLKPQFRHRAHNQYLAIFVTFGLVGLVWFLFSLIYPGLKTGQLFRYRYFVFWGVLMLSMLAEDTLETQMGVTLFAFFNALLLFGVQDD
jgi:hypothetical protein